jgi:hypothetical protein
MKPMQKSFFCFFYSGRFNLVLWLLKALLFVENNQSLTLGAKTFDNTFKIMINSVEPKHYSFGLGIISEY